MPAQAIECTLLSPYAPIWQDVLGTRSITNVSRESREFASCKNVLSGVIWNSPVEKRAAVDAAFITKRSGNYSMHSFSPVDQSLDRLLNQRHVTQVPPRMLEDHD